MQQYAGNPMSTTDYTNDVKNLIALREDLQSIFVQRPFVLVPAARADAQADIGPYEPHHSLRVPAEQSTDDKGANAIWARGLLTADALESLPSSEVVDPLESPAWRALLAPVAIVKGWWREGDACRHVDLVLVLQGRPAHLNLDHHGLPPHTEYSNNRR